MSLPDYGSWYTSGGPPTGSDPASRERGGRRKRLFAMAGSAYNAGRAAVTEIKETYNQGRARGLDLSEGHHTNIPAAFPDVSIAVQGEEQMLLFPSYAKRHTRKYSNDRAEPSVTGGAGSFNDKDYWNEEWRRTQDEQAVVDIDVRGWVYSPHKGPMTRTNRLLIGAARQLSGIPAPRPQETGPSSLEMPGEVGDEFYERKEQERIAKTAKEIEQIGQDEKDAAARGDYSENPNVLSHSNDPEFDSPKGNAEQGENQIPASPRLSPSPDPAKAQTATTLELNDVELGLANANLMSRLGPFLTIPLVRIPMTLFFYNDSESQSRTVETNDAGHFSIRASLEFVPTHVRVIANETLSAVQAIHIVDPRGVSLISDIDDTIKRSNISMGAKEIFRNTFARDLSELTIPGVATWYNSLYNMGVHMHYCSNSPWQLFPVLATFFKLAGLPDGSIHLKHYPGLLQGIFEPVAERKKPTLEKIMNDFPERKFLLIGDSGEADLEVYTDLARCYPNRILAIFIRDVTTREQPSFFDSSVDPVAMRKAMGSSARSSIADIPSDPPVPSLPPRPMDVQEIRVQRPVTAGKLIDFSEESRELESTPLPQSQKIDKSSGASKPSPPPRPTKPIALRSSPSGLGGDVSSMNTSENSRSSAPPPPKPRRSLVQHPLTQNQNSNKRTSGGSNKITSNLLPKIPPRQETFYKGPAPPPPSRRRGTPSSTASVSPRSMVPRHTDVGTNDIAEWDLGPASTSTPSTSRVNSSFSGGRRSSTPEPYNKKAVMWKTRLERAQDDLSTIGVKLYTWRRGDDVLKETESIVRDALRDMGLWR